MWTKFFSRNWIFLKINENLKSKGRNNCETRKCKQKLFGSEILTTWKDKIEDMCEIWHDIWFGQTKLNFSLEILLWKFWYM